MQNSNKNQPETVFSSDFTAIHVWKEIIKSLYETIFGWIGYKVTSDISEGFKMYPII